MNEATLRGAFIDVCRGYSKTEWNKSPLFIRHFSHFEQLDTELEREKYFEIAKKKGIQTNDEKIKWLIDNELWSKEKDKKVRDLSFFIENLKKSKAKALTKAMATEFDKQIKSAQIDLDSLIIEKNNLIGLTAESYAEQKLRMSYIYYSFFKDETLKDRLFSEKQFKRLDDEEIDELFYIYIDYINKFTHDNIKKISISSFFTSYFYLTEDITKFFGKPLYELTYNQVNLISYGSYYRRILAQVGESMPDGIKQDPEKIEEFFNRKVNLKEKPENVNKKGSGFTAYIGATREDDGALMGGAKDDVFANGEIDTVNGAIKSGKLKIGN